jgi:hypothetical protein
MLKQHFQKAGYMFAKRVAVLGMGIALWVAGGSEMGCSSSQASGNRDTPKENGIAAQSNSGPAVGPAGITPTDPVNSPGAGAPPPPVGPSPASLAAKKVCPNCGTANEPNARVCSKCGAKLD